MDQFWPTGMPIGCSRYRRIGELKAPALSAAVTCDWLTLQWRHSRRAVNSEPSACTWQSAGGRAYATSRAAIAFDLVLRPRTLNVVLYKNVLGTLLLPSWCGELV